MQLLGSTGIQKRLQNNPCTAHKEVPKGIWQRCLPLLFNSSMCPETSTIQSLRIMQFHSYPWIQTLSYLWRASSNFCVTFWKKSICCCKKCCICDLKSRTLILWKWWISAKVAKEIMLQRSWMPSAFWCSIFPSSTCRLLSFTLVRAPA